MSIDSGGLASAAPFPRLRTAYLRAIAQAWRDQKFLDQLLEESKGPYGVLPFLERTYHFNFPFNVKFAISAGCDRPHWKPNETLGWFAYSDDIEITLPDAPSAEHLAHHKGGTHADAIALYCEWFPSMFGLPTDPGHSAQPPDDFAQFGVITARLLAMTWQKAKDKDKDKVCGFDKDKSFAEQLYESDDARMLVQSSIGVVVHWNFKLKFRHMPWDCFWDCLDYTNEFKYPEKYKAPPRAAITVHLPVKPDQEAVWPIALAAYNDTGPQYPFTCA